MSKGPQKYPNETRQAAIRMWESGMSLSAVSRELKIAKTTIKHWLDNAGKFKAPVAAGKGPDAIARIQAQAEQHHLSLKLAVYRRIKKQLGDEVNLRDLAYLLDVLEKHQPRAEASPMEGRLVAKISGARERIELEVHELMQSQSAAKEGLAAPQGEGRPAEPAEATAAAEAMASGEENSANG